MTLQNRVTPLAELVADPARGMLMGNRGGRFHDPGTRRVAGRRWAGRAWIICVLDWRERRRDVWGRGYTELFFLDEVTALAAGHRPCMYCRRPAALAYRAAAGGQAPSPRCTELDLRLHAERLDGRGKRLHRWVADDLPDGAVILHEGAATALRGRRALRWHAEGWRDAGSRPSGAVDVLTPPTTLSALGAGYRPLWHASAE